MGYLVNLLPCSQAVLDKEVGLEMFRLVVFHLVQDELAQCSSDGRS